MDKSQFYSCHKQNRQDRTVNFQKNINLQKTTTFGGPDENSHGFQQKNEQINQKTKFEHQQNER